MKGLIFSTDLVPGVLAGTKTVTRRIMKPQPELATKYSPGAATDHWVWKKGDIITSWIKGEQTPEVLELARYHVGEQVYLKETWATVKQYDKLPPSKLEHVIPIWYKADENDVFFEEWRGRWRSGRFMPEWASRAYLGILSVFAGQVQDITPDDCLREGVRKDTYADGEAYFYLKQSRDRKDLCFSSPQLAYAWLWDKINGKGSWAANVWDFRYEIKCFTKYERGEYDHCM